MNNFTIAAAQGNWRNNLQDAKLQEVKMLVTPRSHFDKELLLLEPPNFGTPTELRQTKSLASFKSPLKTFLFVKAFYLCCFYFKLFDLIHFPICTLCSCSFSIIFNRLVWFDFFLFSTL